MDFPARSKPKIKTKVVLVGGVGVGKTSIVYRFVKENFNTKRHVRDDAEIEFAVWDTAGQEQYHSLVPLYFRKASCVIVVYDVTSIQSFNEAKTWISELEHQAPRGVLIAIVGNKIDRLDEVPRQVELSSVSDYARHQLPGDDPIIMTEASAKTGVGVTDLFRQIGDVVVERFHRDAEDSDDEDEVDFTPVSGGRPSNGGCRCN